MPDESVFAFDSEADIDRVLKGTVDAEKARQSSPELRPPGAGYQESTWVQVRTGKDDDGFYKGVFAFRKYDAGRRAVWFYGVTCYVEEPNDHDLAEGEHYFGMLGNTRRGLAVVAVDHCCVEDTGSGSGSGGNLPGVPISSILRCTESGAQVLDGYLTIRNGILTLVDAAGEEVN